MADSDFVGKEVSCRVLGFFFDEFPKKGVAIQKLEEWSGYPLEHLRDKNERIDWESFRRLMSHIGEIWSDEELEEMGKRFMVSPWIKPMAYIGRLLYTPKEALEWTVEPKAGVGRQFFGYTHNSSIMEIEPNRFEMRITMRDGYEPSREFFIVSKGAHIALPNTLGLPDAVIEMKEIEGGCLYDILLPPGGGSLAWLRKAVTKPFTFLKKGKMSEESHRTLGEGPQFLTGRGDDESESEDVPGQFSDDALSENPWKGKEVSCRAMGHTIQWVLNKGVSSDSVENWSEYSLDHLLNKNERIDWESYLMINTKIGELCTDDELEELGRSFPKSMWAKPFILIARLILSPIDNYKWTIRPKRGVGAQLFTCVKSTLQEIGPSHVEIVVKMDKGYAPNREFFLITKGTFSALSEILGYERAKVELEFIDEGARYDIQIPHGRPPLGFLLKAFKWPFRKKEIPLDGDEAGFVQKGITKHSTKSEISFEGKEVSCRPLGVLFDELPKKGIPPETLADWSGYPLKHLRNNNERIDWQSFVKMMSLVGTKLTDEELVELGYCFHNARWLRPITLVGRLLFTPKEFIQWANQPGKGFGNQFFSCIIPSCKEIGPNHLEMKFKMQEGYESSREFALVVMGSFVALPNLFGLDKAKIEMEEIEEGYLFDIWLPPGGGSLAWLRKAVTRPFTARAVGKELKEAFELLHKRHSQLEHEMEVRREAEERFRIVTEGALAGVYIIQDGKFKYVNPALAETFGYSRDELLSGMGPLDLTHPDDHARVSEQMRRRLSGEIEKIRYNFRGLKKDGTIIHCEILGRRHDYQGRPAIIGNLMDITEQVKANEEMKRRFMKFNLVDGRIYLVKESNPNLSIEAFKDLLNVGYNGLVISRDTDDEYRGRVNEDFDFIWIAETGGDESVPPDLEKIMHLIEKHVGRCVILIDRLDYLVAKNGFSAVLSFVHSLREKAHLNQSVSILSVDPSTLNPKEIRLLEKEANEVEPRVKSAISQDNLDLLGFVFKQNSMGLKPSHTDIIKELGLSKPTVRKRISRLRDAGYLREVVSGRRKAVELTENGTQLFLD